MVFKSLYVEIVKASLSPLPLLYIVSLPESLNSLWHVLCLLVVSVHLDLLR